MTELTKLTPVKHGSLKVVPNSVLDLVKQQHLINLRVNEVCMAISSFPAFLTRTDASVDWVLCAVTAFETNKNLFVENEMWHASYQPAAMQTYPFYLMKSPDDEKKYTIGIDEQSDAFSEDEGEALFDDDDNATLYLSQVTALLEASIRNDIQSYEFTRKLNELGLIKPIDVLVEYYNGTTNTLKGLYTINEDKLQSLSQEQFEDLRKKDYLAPIYAMLISLFQLNQLLRKHNEIEGTEKVKQIKTEFAKDYADL